jgi:fluoride exporter
MQRRRAGDSPVAFPRARGRQHDPRRVFSRWLPWWLDVALNPVFPDPPLLSPPTSWRLFGRGSRGHFGHHTGLPPDPRLFALAGFLGGLFADIVSLVSRVQYAWALAAASAHLFGSLPGVRYWLACAQD